jgi:tetratricopeptide (TPR) repeat protein
MIQIYQRDKKFKDAEKTLLTAEKYFKNKEGYHFMLGSMYERQKEFDKAEKTFKKVIELNPKHAAALNYLGYMLADRGVRLEESLSLIQKAVDLDPNNGAYLDSLGWAYFKLNRVNEAETYLRRHWIEFERIQPFTSTWVMFTTKKVSTPMPRQRGKRR